MQLKQREKKNELCSKGMKEEEKKEEKDEKKNIILKLNRWIYKRG